MDISKEDSKMLKGIAIMFMLLLHLFCRKDINGLYATFPIINDVPAVYYIGLFGDACVPIYCFVSGYGLFLVMKRDMASNLKKNFSRVLKLLINFWIVLLMFVLIGSIVGDEYPGSLGQFLMNFLLLSNSYNSAWWFLQTYVILVAFSPFLFSLIKRYNSAYMIIFFGFVYLISYIQRIKVVFSFESEILSSIVNSIVLVGTSLLPFVIGAIFAKDKVISKFSSKIVTIKYRNIIGLMFILLLVVGHSLYESMIVAPFTAIAFICIFTLMNKGPKVKRVLSYLGDHSTNIWLTHMFFYMTLFPKLTFAPYYPIFIFTWLLLLCLMSSHIINLFFKPLLKFVFKHKTKAKIETRSVAG
ncbi:acyltransferase family protein [Mesobacillus foraminis]|uniref:acyltransferase family protein n=1 Tax=Mesobacillus foraminis TaxID=279826 RepID=UPI000EF4739D|nr:acyltransferase [Mesobacillus foraminis]